MSTVSPEAGYRHEAPPTAAELPALLASYRDKWTEARAEIRALDRRIKSLKGSITKFRKVCLQLVTLAAVGIDALNRHGTDAERARAQELMAHLPQNWRLELSAAVERRGLSVDTKQRAFHFRQSPSTSLDLDALRREL